jgi:hypothetical protein
MGVRSKITGVILLSLVCINTFIPQQQARAEVCPVYNFQSIFFEEYSAGKTWDNRSGNRSITWSANASVIHDESVSRSFTPEELEWTRSAFQSWDDALDTVKFSEISQSTQAEIVIGFVALTSAANQPGATGYWNAWWSGSWRNRATIKLKVGSTSWFSVKSQFIHAVQHELGNVLGLGDIKPTNDFASTQEDSWQPPYGPIPLSEYDTGMIRQLYGESTCPSTFPNAAANAAAQLKAKQEAELRAAAELKAKLEAAEAAAKVAAELKAKQEAEAKAAAELIAKQEAEAKAIAEAAAQKVIQDDFNAVTSSYQKLLLRIYDLKIKFPRVSNLLGIEEKLLRLPIILGNDLSTAKYNIQSVNDYLDTSEKVWEKTQKTTITCVKGKLIKKVTSIKPKCPSGYKLKK